jgi:lysophospholipase L1-like esterase
MARTERRSIVEDQIPAPPTGRHLTARDAVLVMASCVILLLLFEGASIRRSGDEMTPGWERTLVLAVGKPAGALSDATGLGSVKNRLVAWAHPADDASGPGGFEQAAARVPGRQTVPPVTPDAFDPRQIGQRPRPPRPLRTVLVTGDSLAQPLDAKIARAFASAATGVRVVRDARIGTSISQTDIVDWGRLSGSQTRRLRPEAVVMFMGANEGFPIRTGGRTLECCGAAWAAAYAGRARQMMNTYRQNGAARVYWLTLPGPRDPDRQRIGRTINAAIAVAAAPYRAQVRVVDMTSLFTPGGRYRASMPVGGRDTLVRQADGVHLNPKGADVALGPVLAAMRADFGAARVPR